MKARFAAAMQKSIDGSVDGASGPGYRVLGADEPAPFVEERIGGRSNFVIDRKSVV